MVRKIVIILVLVITLSIFLTQNSKATDTTPPSSNLTIAQSVYGSYYWYRQSTAITANATDDVGVANVSLYYRYSSDNSSWGSWTLYGIDTNGSDGWSWSFTFPSGEGYYQFKSLAIDTSGNTEEGQFVRYEDIITGIGSVSLGNSVPDVFEMNSKWYLVSGREAGTFSGFEWNGSAWVSNSSIAPSADVGDDSAPTIFNMSGKWYLISGNYSGQFQGFEWNGSAWVSNSSIAPSADIGTLSRPTVFNMSGKWYLISGNYSGQFQGFEWNGSAWVSNSSIAPSADVGYGSSPTVFNMNSKWYLITGTGYSAGWFKGYEWNGTAWVSNNSIVPSYYKGDWTSPNVFSMSNKFYLIQGYNTGCFYGFILLPSSTAIAGYDTTVPSLSWKLIPSEFWHNSSMLVSAYSADSLSGVQFVDLSYYYSTDNSSFSKYSYSRLYSGENNYYNFTFNFPSGDGYYELDLWTHDNAGNGGEVILSTIGYDTTPPSSSVNTISPYWHNSGITVVTTASDSLSGMHNTSLYYRYSSGNSTWGNWTYFGKNETGSTYWNFSFNFPSGEGYYQFYSIANDTSGNTESAPTSADAIAGYDHSNPFVIFTTPTSPYWHNSAIVASSKVTDSLSGSSYAKLYYSYSTDNSTWGSWTYYATNNSGINDYYNFSFSFPSGEGYYKFEVFGYDNAENEGIVQTGSYTGYDATPPSSSVNTISPYWHNSGITVVTTASDSLSGMHNTSLYYRYSSGNSTWGNWTYFGKNETGSTYWNFSFNFPSGEGYYQFYSIANDTSGNTESAPTSADTICGYDITNPSSSIMQIAYWQNNTTNITIQPTDNLAVKQATLYYRYSSDNSTWSNWTIVNTTTSSPWNISFTFPNGMKYYQFRALAQDMAGNLETKTTIDLSLGKPIPCYFSSVNRSVAGSTVIFTDLSAISTHTKWIVDGKTILNQSFLSGNHQPLNLTYTFNLSNVYNITLQVYNQTFNTTNSYSLGFPVDRNITLALSPNKVGINYITYSLNQTINASTLMDMLQLKNGEWLHRYNSSSGKWMSLWEYNNMKIGNNFIVSPWDVVVAVVGSPRTVRINITFPVNTTQHTNLSQGYHYLSWSNGTSILSSNISKIGLQKGDWIFMYNINNETWYSYNVGLSGDIFKINPYDAIVVNLASVRTMDIG